MRPGGLFIMHNREAREGPDPARRLIFHAIYMLNDNIFFLKSLVIPNFLKIIKIINY